MSDPDLVLYEQIGAIALITLNRPKVRNAQNSALLYRLDERFHEAAMEDSVRSIVLRGAGPAFSSGHDIGRGRDAHVSYAKRTMWPDHIGKPPIEGRLYREQEVYLELTRRWRELPKPTIAAVHGACLGAGLMLAWACDLIVASEDAIFGDPVIAMGMPGVEFFAHPWEMGPRFAKEFLYIGEPINAARALELGMVNRVVPGPQLLNLTLELAAKVATRSAMALALAKKSVNVAQDHMGMRDGIEHAFALHQLAHAHNREQTGDDIAGLTAREMKRSIPD